MGDTNIKIGTAQTIETGTPIVGLEVEGDKCIKAENGFMCKDACVALTGNNKLIYDPSQKLCNWTIFNELSATKFENVLDMALVAANTLEEWDFEKKIYTTFSLIAADAGLLKDKAAAVETANKISQFGEDKAAVLRDIAVTMAKAGLFVKAVKTANMIKFNGEWYKADALRQIAVAMAKAGLFVKAVKTANMIKDAWHRGDGRYCKAEALKDIAVVMANASLFVKAVKTANKIGVAGDKAGALRGIAVAMAKAGLFDEATKTANKIEDAEEKTYALADIAAVKTANTIGGKEKKTATPTDIAVAKGGDAKLFDEDVKTANAIKDTWKKAYALKDIAVAMAKAGLFDKAVETANTIKNAGAKAYAFIDIAVAMREREVAAPCPQ